MMRLHASREQAAALRSQRRFLILISLAVAAYYTLAVHLKGEGEYSGFAVKIGRPDRIPLALWVVFAWALVRYAQRLHELWRIVGKTVMREFEYCDHQLVLEAARRSAIEQVKAGRMGKDMEKPRVIGDVWVTDTVKEMMRERMVQQARVRGQPIPKREPDPWFVIENGKRVYRGFGVGILGAGEPHAVGHDFMMPQWSRTRAAWHVLRAWVRTAIRLPAVSEYIAPLVIALIAVALAVVSMMPSYRVSKPVYDAVSINMTAPPMRAAAGGSSTGHAGPARDRRNGVAPIR